MERPSKSYCCAAEMHASTPSQPDSLSLLQQGARVLGLLGSGGAGGATVPPGDVEPLGSVCLISLQQPTLLSLERGRRDSQEKPFRT
jgi:hypothetical protein